MRNTDESALAGLLIVVLVIFPCFAIDYIGGHTIEQDAIVIQKQLDMGSYVLLLESEDEIYKVVFDSGKEWNSYEIGQEVRFRVRIGLFGFQYNAKIIGE